MRFEGAGKSQALSAIWFSRDFVLCRNAFASDESLFAKIFVAAEEEFVGDVLLALLEIRIACIQCETLFLEILVASRVLPR
ncbi:hypothetical protein WL84_09950 [Burkholderia cenocepacia]|nr:hypothetical protein WL84_09950 [Burkholderia cenocepacia]